MPVQNSIQQILACPALNSYMYLASSNPDTNYIQ